MGVGRIILLCQPERGEAFWKWFETEQSKQRNSPAPTIMQAYAVQIHTQNGDKALARHNKAIKATTDLYTSMINTASSGH